MRLADYSVPVSYTHLDVYKRQRERTAVHQGSEVYFALVINYIGRAASYIEPAVCDKLHLLFFHVVIALFLSLIHI